MVITHNLRGDDYRNVWLDGKPLDPIPSLKVFNHSPDGFNWGYGGSGPAQLAAAIYLELPKENKFYTYQEFKWRVIAVIPRGSFDIEFNFKDGILNKVKKD